MKIDDFIGKHFFKIVWLITIVGAILAVVFINRDASRNISDQVTSLYEKESLVQQYFALAQKMDGVTCYINEDNNVFVFEEKDCSLKVKYSKDGALLVKEIKDSRVGANVGIAIVAIMGAIVVCFVASIILLLILWVMVDQIVNIRNLKNKKAENKETQKVKD